MPQRDQWIDSRGAARGNETGSECNEDEEQNHTGQGNGSRVGNIGIVDVRTRVTARAPALPLDVAPMPRASVRTAITANPGARRSVRAA